MTHLTHLAATILVLANVAACHLYEEQSANPDGHVADAAPVSDATRDAYLPDAWVPQPLLCTDGMPTASVAGKTPRGAVMYTNAWPAYYGGKCSDLEVFLTASDPVDARDLTAWPVAVDSLRFWLPHPWPQGWLGTHDNVTFRLQAGVETLTVQGSVTIDQFDEPYSGKTKMPEVRGSIAVHAKDAGWAIEGSFGSSYCMHLGVACP